MLYNELEQGDILSGVRLRLALLAYTDILLCSIWAIHRIRQTPERKYPPLVEVLDHGRSQLRFALPDNLIWQFTFRPPCLIGVREPGLRQEQPFVNQRIALLRRIGGKHAHLTGLHLAQRAAIWASHPDGVLSFFREPRLLDRVVPQ